tara:strand:+ start:3980 stop:4843 length:864 start_codon:yes stop_codon:yes gene_type:complete
MRAQYDNTLMSSFYLWFDHELLTRGEAFTNFGSFFYDVNSLFQGYNTYGSPFKQFVSDSSVPNANIINNVVLNGAANNRGVNNFAAINYDQGQVYFTSPVTNPNTTLSGNYAVKDFNIFITNDLEEELLFETNFALNNRTNATATGLPPNAKTYPAIFLKNNGSRNEPFEFGGGDMTYIDVRAIVLSDSQFKLDAVASIFRDRGKTIIPIIPESNMPFNSLGDFAGNIQYNYNTLTANTPPESGVFVENVFVSKIGGLSYSQKTNLNPEVFSMIVDFELQDFRYPRA